MARHRGEWVHKSDLLQWVRCPYAYWLLYSGRITEEQAVSDDERQRMDAGVEFQSRVEASIPPVRVSSSNIATYFRENGSARLYQPPTLENRALKIYGRADAIEVVDGALYPVEVKAHKDVHPNDELELAFYWQMLEPYRTRSVEPAGILILQRDGKPVEVRVPIRPRRFDWLDRQLQNLRDARREGVQPRLCPCTVCTGVARNEVLAAIAANRDLTLISGIRRTRASVLEEHCAIASWDALLACEPWTVTERFNENSNSLVTIAEVECWRLHALAYHHGTPAIFDPIEPFPVEGDYIALDLEYLSETNFIWLIGVCEVHDDERTVELRWAADDHEERRNIEWTEAFVAERPRLPAVTWFGRSADVPTLEKAARRHGIDVASVLTRHLDLAAWVRRNLRLPIPMIELKHIARYFGMTRTSLVGNGLEASNLYRRAVDTGNPLLRERLCDYNTDDLHSLIGVVEGLRSIVSSDLPTLPDRSNCRTTSTQSRSQTPTSTGMTPIGSSRHDALTFRSLSFAGGHGSTLPRIHRTSPRTRSAGRWQRSAVTVAVATAVPTVAGTAHLTSRTHRLFASHHLAHGWIGARAARSLRLTSLERTRRAIASASSWDP